MNQLKKNCRALELDKILEQLSEHTYCSDTAQMARELSPSVDTEKVRRELQKTDDAFVLSSRFGTPPFIGLHDPAPDLKRAQAGVSVGTLALLNFAAVLRECRLLGEWRGHCEETSTSLDGFFNRLVENRHLENRITSCILSEDQIADDASDALLQIRRSIRRQSQRARDNLEKLVRGSAQKFLQENIITMRDNRYVVPVKAEHRGEVPGLVHDTSSSGATVFVEPMSVVEANNEVRVLLGKEKEEIERILLLLSKEAGEYAEQIQNDYRLILLLDLTFAKANLAADMKAMKPEVGEDGVIFLHKARHPLLNKESVVPIDIQLGDRFHSLIITGPNTGGKTVALKTVGLLTLMAMCGLMIPASDGSRVSVFKRVLVDIGDEQSIEQSLSTFSAHMTNIAGILQIVDKQSLVLVDELGSGTDPEEGAALAVAIIEQIGASGACLAATTHYPELKIYALDTEGVENACCEFDVATLRPTYRLLIGVPGRSNAFAISRRIGLPEPLLQRAEQLVSGGSKGFEEVVERLEESRRAYESELAKQKENSAAIDRLKKALEEKEEKLRERTEKEWENAQKQAKYMVDSVQSQTNRLLNELDELRKQKDTTDPRALAGKIKEATAGRLNRLHAEANPVHERQQTDYQLPRPLKKGDQVLVYDLNKRAEVLQTADKSGKVMVQMGAMKTRVPLENLRLVEQKKTAKPKFAPTRTVRSKLERSGSTEIDLRGENAEEALMELDRFIDNCVLSNIETITIIHGKGTGVLRKAVQQHLRRHPSVRSYRLGTFGEGEAGVTIAELK